ncbi:MAG: DNA repair protein RadA [Nocardioidaceae bacterium]
MAKTASPKPAASFRCAECGWSTMKWVGRCGECQTWGAIEELGAAASSRVTAGPVTSAALPICEVRAEAAVSRPTHVGELDRVLGGGIVPGAVLLLAGEPGVGKSTLLLEVAAQAARGGATTLYVSGEESAAQVRLRAERTGALEERLYLAAEVELSAVLSHIDAVNPDLLVIDSIQTLGASDVDGTPGGVTQVRAVTAALVREAKRRHLPTVLVGHVTKDGAIAGPRVLEHVVDVVLQFEGDHNSRLRLLRAVKNRFGPVNEIGCFDLSDDGIVEVADPTGLFISNQRTSQHGTPMSGTCVTVTLEGRRPMLAEVQCLVDTSALPTPRRAVSGLDSARLAMLLAVLQRRVGLRLGQCDVYAASIGGASLRQPAADLAVAVSVASAALGVPVAHRMVAIGEVGLAGELRPVPSLRQRLAEAARLGFTHAVVPAASGVAEAASPQISGLTVVECPDVWRALRVLDVVTHRFDGSAPDLHVLPGG